MNDAPISKESVINAFTGNNFRSTSFVVSYGNAEEALGDLRLPPELVEMLQTVLLPDGWTLEEDKVPYTPRASYRRYTSIKQNQERLECVLLHMPAWFLMAVDNFSADLALLPQCFSDKKTRNLFICCSESLGVGLPETFESIMVYWESQYNIEGKFLPWSSFQKLEQKSLDERALWLHTVLRLNMISPTKPDVPPAPLPSPNRLKLDGKQLRRLNNALTGAFPNRGELEQMVRYWLGESLDNISKERNLSDDVFQLTKWAEAEGKMQALVEGALEERPGNQELRDFVAEVMPSSNAGRHTGNCH